MLFTEVLFWDVSENAFSGVILSAGFYSNLSIYYTSILPPLTDKTIPEREERVCMRNEVTGLVPVLSTCRPR